MLARKHRIKKKKEIENIFKKGRSFRQDFLILKIIKNDLGSCRFAFIVSKKISKKAVERNKVKRSLRAAAGPKIKFLKQGFDVLFIALPAIKEKKFKEIEEAVNELFKKAKITGNK